MKLKKKYEKDLLKLQKFKLKNFYVFRQVRQRYAFYGKTLIPNKDF